MSDLLTRDHHILWHPCSQMKDYETFKPLEIVSASGSYITLKNGKKVIDAISSWWSKNLGHNHPQIKKALIAQIEKFEHVMLANTTNENIVDLSEKLIKLVPHLNKVCYASDGSCAIEIALKMSLHARKVLGQNKKTAFLALENAYHGETTGAMSVSDIGLYRDPYQSILFDTHFLSGIPYVNDMNDPLWKDASPYWEKIEKTLESLTDHLTAIIVEPIVQGAAHMKMYSQDFLRRLYAFAKARDIHFIADEIMTGFGRTGKMFAFEHAGIQPDFVCLGKGLTSGWLPLSAVILPDAIYEIFYDDYSSGKNFLHSHTYSGNALAVSVALETLHIYEAEIIDEKAVMLGKHLRASMEEVSEKTKRLENIRGLGGIIAADLIVPDKHHRYGFEVYQKATAEGALLRPLGNTIYWLPPLNITIETIDELKHITKQAIVSVLNDE